MLDQHGRRVYRDFRFLWPVRLILVALVVITAIMMVVAVRDGGISISLRTHAVSIRRNSPYWFPMPYAIPALLLLTGPFLVLFTWVLSGIHRACITTDDTGVTQMSGSGKVVFRARWDEVTEIRRNRKGRTVLMTTRGRLAVRHNHTEKDALLADFERHTGLTPQLARVSSAPANRGT